MVPHTPREAQTLSDDDEARTHFLSHPLALSPSDVIQMNSCTKISMLIRATLDPPTLMWFERRAFMSWFVHCTDAILNDYTRLRFLHRFYAALDVGERDDERCHAYQSNDSDLDASCIEMLLSV